MKHTDYVYVDIWFAWRPVKLDTGKWVWFKYVKRTIDERDLVYLGLLETTVYSKLNYEK